MSDETIITYETPVSEIERVARIMGEGLKSKFAVADYPHACSDLIHLEIITNLSEIASKLSLPLSQMCGNRKYVYWWLQGMPTMRALMTAIPYWAQLDVNMLTSAPIVRSHSASELEKLPENISTDIYAFCMFVIWYGAKPECKRRILNNRATKTLDNMRKKIGVQGILGLMWMAATEYVVLGEKVFEPAWKNMTSGKDDRKVNSMSARTATLTRGRKREVSSFADLAALRQ